MNRRDMLSIGAATAAAHILTSVAGCAAQNAAVATPAAAGGAPNARAVLQRAVAECIRAGEACLAHCIRDLSAGSTAMAQCAAKVRVMLAICKAVEVVATTDSPHLVALAKLCAAACTECADACSAHASTRRVRGVREGVPRFGLGGERRG